MPNRRREDQTVEAFSAPKDLLKEAAEKAVELGLSKSGYFRYCLAKELGYEETEARELALNSAVQRARAGYGFGAMPPLSLNEKPTPTDAADQAARQLAKKQRRKKPAE